MKSKGLLYVEIANTLKKDILEGIYPVGSQIPTENELEAYFKVSKITVRKAIEILSSEGYLEKKSGKGTTVLSNRLFNKLSKAASFSSMIEENGHHLAKEILAVEKIQVGSEATDIALAFGKEAYKLTRFYRLDHEPYIYFEHYLPVLGEEQVLAEIGADSLYKWLANYQKLVNKFQDSFAVAPAETRIQELLDTDSPYLLKRIRTSYSQNGEIIEISHAMYDTNKFPYMIEYEI